VTNAVLTESAFDAAVTSIPSAHHRAALYRHNIFLTAELKEVKAELAKALKAVEIAEQRAKEALKVVPSIPLSNNESDIRKDERMRVADVIDQHSVGDTVRAKNGQKIAHMIRSGEWK
jgi:GTP1/Obg family GTP-binding protein